MLPYKYTRLSEISLDCYMTWNPQAVHAGELTTPLVFLVSHQRGGEGENKRWHLTRSCAASTNLPPSPNDKPEGPTT